MKTNIIYNEDCIEGMKKLPDECVDLVVTDPPYLINYKTNYRVNKSHDFCFPIINDTNDSSFLSLYVKEIYRIMKNNTAGYMFCNMNKIDVFKSEIEKFFKIKNIIIWVKNNWTAGDLQAAYGKQYEIIILFNKGRKTINGKRLTDVWRFNRVSGKTQQHQNQKPLELLKQCIEKHSNINDIVFDGCIGSGTTAVACKQLRRKYIGFEIDKKYYNIALKRLQEN